MHFITLKKETSNYSKCSAFSSRTFSPIFYSNSVSFVEGRRKNISCPRAQGTLAAPLETNFQPGLDLYSISNDIWMLWN